MNNQSLNNQAFIPSHKPDGSANPGTRAEQARPLRGKDLARTIGLGSVVLGIAGATALLSGATHESTPDQNQPAIERTNTVPSTDPNTGTYPGIIVEGGVPTIVISGNVAPTEQQGLSPIDPVQGTDQPWKGMQTTGPNAGTEQE